MKLAAFFIVFFAWSGSAFAQDKPHPFWEPQSLELRITTTDRNGVPHTEADIAAWAEFKDELRYYESRPDNESGTVFQELRAKIKEMPSGLLLELARRERQSSGHNFNVVFLSLTGVTLIQYDAARCVDETSMSQAQVLIQQHKNFVQPSEEDRIFWTIAADMLIESLHSMPDRASPWWICSSGSSYLQDARIVEAGEAVPFVEPEEWLVHPSEWPSIREKIIQDLIDLRDQLSLGGRESTSRDADEENSDFVNYVIFHCTTDQYDGGVAGWLSPTLETKIFNLVERRSVQGQSVRPIDLLGSMYRNHIRDNHGYEVASHCKTAPESAPASCGCRPIWGDEERVGRFRSGVIQRAAEKQLPLFEVDWDVSIDEAFPPLEQ